MATSLQTLKEPKLLRSRLSEELAQGFRLHKSLVDSHPESLRSSNNLEKVHTSKDKLQSSIKVFSQQEDRRVSF